MKKTLIAAAVAAALPAVALAQTNVTLSGNLKSGIAQTKFSNGATGNGSATEMVDGSSRIIIGGSENLGNGLKAVFQVDNRFRVDDNASGGTLGTGNTFVGISGGFGTLRTGKLDTYYNLGTDEFSARAVAIQHSNISLLGWVNGNSSSAAIARVSRSTNVLRYDLPSFSGVKAGLSWSPNANGSEGVPGASQGQAYAADVGYAAGPLSLGAAYWNEKNEGATNSGQTAWRVFGSYDFGVAKVGLLFDDSKVKVAGVDTKRGAWSVPVTAKVGSGVLLFTYTQAQDTKTAGNSNSNTGARQISVGYDYPLSKRTSLGASYSVINNESGARYGYYNASLANLPSTVAGQDSKQFYVGVRHAF